MKRVFKYLLLLLVVMALGAGGLLWYRHRHAADPLAGVITAEAERGDIELAVLATGALRPAKMVAVGAQVSGRITALNVKLGQTVKAGDLIAQIDSLPQQNALKTANAALANVQAQLQEKQASLVYAKQALRRAQSAFDTHATSQDALQSAQTTVLTTEAQIAALNAEIVEAQIGVQIANINLQYTRVTAPIDGTVLLIIAQQGQTLNAAQSTPTIVVLGQIDNMTVRAEISEADVTKVKPGQDVYFTVLGDPVKQFHGKLESVDPAPDTLRSDSEIATTNNNISSNSSDSTATAVYYYGRFDVPNPDRFLKTYMTAEVHIVLGEAKNAVIVPSTAIRTNPKNGNTFVEVIGNDGSVERRKVEVGLDDKVRAEIKSGLDAGERVVSSRSSGNFVGTNFMRRRPGPMGL
jgi:macrolide-specific efflux system membrane fusion protein